MKKLIKKIVPTSCHFWLAEIKNLFFSGYRQKHYSQFGEDLVVSQIFNNKTEGFYVDIGAHHPFRYSNTYLLFKRGWRGINVEPNHYAIKLFKIFRRRDINLEAGVSGQAGQADYYYFSDPAYNTFSAGQAGELLKTKKWLRLRKIRRLPVLTLETILNKYLPKEIKIDFLNIDVEGLDLIVLKSNNWQRFKPKVIAVESPDFDFDRPGQDEIFSYLRALDYQLKAVIGCSLIFSLD